MTQSKELLQRGAFRELGEFSLLYADSANSTKDGAPCASFATHTPTK
jgi:hypothetical protein